MSDNIHLPCINHIDCEILVHLAQQIKAPITNPNDLSSFLQDPHGRRKELTFGTCS